MDDNENNCAACVRVVGVGGQLCACVSVGDKLAHVCKHLTVENKMEKMSASDAVAIRRVLQKKLARCFPHADVTDEEIHTSVRDLVIKKEPREDVTKITTNGDSSMKKTSHFETDPIIKKEPEEEITSRRVQNPRVRIELMSRIANPERVVKRNTVEIQKNPEYGISASINEDSSSQIECHLCKWRAENPAKDPLNRQNPRTPMKKHVMECHMLQNITFKCLYCTYSVKKYDTSAIKRHLRARHPHKDPEFKDFLEEKNQEMIIMLQRCFPEVDFKFTSQKSIQCRICKNSVAYRDSGNKASQKKNHITRNHIKKPVFECRYCSKKVFLTNAEGIRKHLRKLHPKKPVSFKNNLSDLQNEIHDWMPRCFHDEIIKKEKAMKRNRMRCRICNEEIRFTDRTSKPNAKVYHILKSHLKKPRFKCHYCAYQCLAKCSLKSHHQSFHSKKSPIFKDEYPTLRADIKEWKSRCFADEILRIEKELKKPTLKCQLCAEEIRFLPTTQAKSKCKRDHILKIHLKKPAHECLYCPYTVAPICTGTIRFHLKMTHPTDPITFKNNVVGLRKEICEMSARCFPKVIPDTEEERRKKSITCRTCKEEIRYISTQCKYTRIRTHVLKKHMEKSTFECHYCSYTNTAVNLSNIKNHLQSYHPESPATFKNNLPNLRREMDEMLQRCFVDDITIARENKKKRLPCKICGEEIKFLNYSSSAKRLHVMKKHLKKPSSECLYCSYQNFDLCANSMMEHQRGVHPQESSHFKNNLPDLRKEIEEWMSRCFSDEISRIQKEREERYGTKTKVLGCRMCKMEIHYFSENPYQRIMSGRNHILKDHLKKAAHQCRYCDHKIYTISTSHIKRHLHAMHPKKTLKFENNLPTLRKEIDQMMQRCFGDILEKKATKF